MKEGKYLEFKEGITNTFLKTVSAFANYGEGEIIFGIKDDGAVKELSNPDDICLSIENKINDLIDPKPDFSFRINRVNKTVSLIVSEGIHKPYLYKGKAYKRNDTSTVEIDQLELRRLVMIGSKISFEELKVDESDLSFNYLFDSLKSKMNIVNPDDDILRTLGLMDANKTYNNAGLLLADKNNFSGIDIARFGNSLNEILYRETISGISILEQFDRVEEVFNTFYRLEKIEGMRRREEYLIPIESFRETVANALVHRTWDIGAHIRIAMHPDRIEVYSVGGLPIGLKEKEYLDGYISNLRNPIIANVFFRLDIIESFGTGIRRIKDSYRDIDRKPVFKVSDNVIMTTLPTINAKVRLSLDEKAIVDALSSGIYLASSELAENTGFNKSKVVRLLNSLLEKNYVAKEGSGRGTKYYLM